MLHITLIVPPALFIPCYKINIRMVSSNVKRPFSCKPLTVGMQLVIITSLTKATQFGQFGLLNISRDIKT